MSTRRTSQDFADTLARIWLFEECTKKERRRIASLVTPIRVDAGQVLARQGDYARECVIVIDGQGGRGVRRTDRGSRRRRVAGR